MCGQELRRRLQAIDPNLHIVSGRRGKLPLIIGPEEEPWWGLGDAPPRIPPDEILAIEATYSLKQLRSMAEGHGIDPKGDKELLVRKLVHFGAIENYG